MTDGGGAIDRAGHGAPGATRFLASGDESGTAPEDRPFRPDVEGLRAVAVLLVVLFHSGVSALSGGYIGVDVFFVISGFVITGVLLRERATYGRDVDPRLLRPALSADHPRRDTGHHRHRRRCRYFFLGIGAGGRTANDGRWATVFLANFHFSCARDQLPGLAAAALAAPELLVAVGRGAVLRRLPHVVPGAGGHAHPRCRSGCAWRSGSSSSSARRSPSRSSTPRATPPARTSRRSPGRGSSPSARWSRWGPRGSRRGAEPPRRPLATWVGLGAILYGAVAFDSQQRLSRVAGGDPGRRGGADHRRWRQRRAPRGRGAAGSRPVPMARQALVLALSLALADPDHRGRVRGQDDSVGPPTTSAGTWSRWRRRCSPTSWWRTRSATPGPVPRPLGERGPRASSWWPSLSGPSRSSPTWPVGQVPLEPASGRAIPTVVGAGVAAGGAAGLVAASDKIRTVPVEPCSTLVPSGHRNRRRISVSRPSAQDVGRRLRRARFQRAYSVTAWSSHDGPLRGLACRHVVPACDAIAKRAHWRLVVLTKPACLAAPLPTQAPGLRGDWVACDRWHRFADQSHQPDRPKPPDRLAGVVLPGSERGTLFARRSGRRG